MSISDTRALFGDSISGVVKSSSGSAWTQCTFSYFGSVSSVSVSGMNLDVNDFANNVTQFPDYGAIIYSCPVSAVSSYYDFILDIPVYFPDYALGAIGISNMLDGHDWSGITQSGNVVSSYPDNYYSGFEAVTAREPSSVYGVYYYNNVFYRMFPYLVDSNGDYLSSLHVQSVRSYAVNYQPAVLMMIFTPNVGGLPSNTEPVQTTGTTSITSPPSTNIDVNVSVYVDNSGIESQLNEYLGADDTCITTYETINLGTFPTFDYNNATQTVNISQVVSETGDGINSIWYLISGLFSSVPVLVWLVPFCIFMSIMSFVLWRKGG